MECTGGSQLSTQTYLLHGRQVDPDDAAEVQVGECGQQVHHLMVVHHVVGILLQPLHFVG